jgi:hypothetical protein
VCWYCSLGASGGGVSLNLSAIQAIPNLGSLDFCFLGGGELGREEARGPWGGEPGGGGGGVESGDFFGPNNWVTALIRPSFGTTIGVG